MEKPELKLPPAKRSFKEVKQSHKAVDQAQQKYFLPVQCNLIACISSMHRHKHTYIFIIAT